MAKLADTSKDIPNEIPVGSLIVVNREVFLLAKITAYDASIFSIVGVSNRWCDDRAVSVIGGSHDYVYREDLNEFIGKPWHLLEGTITLSN